ncbi:MAG: hypothetical protein V1944_01205 [Candidatus Aenigmatarchaeota archaeon]
MPRRNFKMVLFWIIGSISILVGAMIAGNVEKTLGTDDTSVGAALFIALILILLGGLLWITVAVAAKKISFIE